MKNKVLIFGINGLTGRHLSNFIIRKNLAKEFNFKGYDIRFSHRYLFDVEVADLSIRKNLEDIISKENPDFIINLTCSTNNNDFESLLNINVSLPKDIIEIILNKKHNLKKLLLIGSAAEYGNNSDFPLKEDSDLKPVNLYGLSKVFQSELVKYYSGNYPVNINIARTFNIFSEDLPANLSLGSFIKQIDEIKNEGTIYVGNINTKRDFLPIENIIDAYWEIMLNGRNGEIYNVCSGKSILIKDILKWLIKRSGKRIKIQSDISRIKTYDIMDSFGENSKLLKDTSWKPILLNMI